jgi:RNA polymerase sigma factor (TIGR02999 family)
MTFHDIRPKTLQGIFVAGPGGGHRAGPGGQWRVVIPFDNDAIEAHLPVVYEELRRLAERYVREQPQGTLQPTALVHEAWMKLDGHRDRFEGREHYSAVAARAMRQVLLDRARHRGRQKRGADPVRTTLSGLASEGPVVDLFDLNRALEELAAVDPRGAQVVELRYFGGMSAEEIARWLAVSPRTVQSSWRIARAFLVQRLGSLG